VKIKSGSFGLLNPVLSYSRKLHRRWSASVCADYMRADGKYPYTLVNGTIKTREKRMNSDVETLRLEGNLYGDFGRRGGSFETKLYTFHSGRGLPGSVNFYNKTATERLWNDNSFIQAGYKNQWDERFAVQAFAKYTYAYSRYKDVNDEYSAGYQEDRNTQYERYASAGVRYTPSGGLSASFTTDYAHTTLHNNFINAVQPRRNTSLTVFAVQHKSNRFTATGSALGTYISDKADNGDRPADRKHLSPAVAFSWQPSGRNALRIRVSYKDIFRVPTFTDLYYLRMGNTGLKPEKAKQYNAGLTWSGNAGRIVRYLNLSADGYYNKVEDKIVALPTLYIWRMMNMGEVEIAGADVNLSAELPLSGNINMIISGNYTYQYAIDITNPDAKNYGHQIPYTPRHTGHASATVETPRINVSWLLTAVGERYALPQNTSPNRVDAYVEQGISLNRTFTWRNASLRLQGEVLNLADTQYDVIQYYPMPGRSWRLSVTLNIQ
ncbi:MAG: TonB-dependent receptor, partial [Tannerella sp.]|nr:TonB-dependent receptor [Tannerella sp.]